MRKSPNYNALICRRLKSHNLGRRRIEAVSGNDISHERCTRGHAIGGPRARRVINHPTAPAGDTTGEIAMDPGPGGAGVKTSLAVILAATPGGREAPPP